MFEIRYTCSLSLDEKRHLEIFTFAFKGLAVRQYLIQSYRTLVCYDIIMTTSMTFFADYIFKNTFRYKRVVENYASLSST